jgi:predicted ATPase/DNA-binding CsgD family transcriptional regulator
LATADLRRMLLAAPGIVTVVGTGGVGKSTLVEQATREPATWSPWDVEGIVVELADVSRADLVLPAIASATGVSGSTGDPLAMRLRMALSAEVQLLVLDNFEHVLDAATDIAELAQGCPELRVVVTSRTPLRVRGERVVHLSPLPLPGAGATLDDPALALFAAGATRTDPDLVIEGSVTTIASICRQLDGLPLAIELAAARSATLSPVQIEALLAEGRHLAVLRHGPSDLPERQRDLKATVAWSHGLLGPGEQRLLELLSGFAGWFGFDDATAVSGTDVGTCLDELSVLVDAQLLLSEQVDDERRYRMAVPVREFCTDRLDADPEAARRGVTAHRDRAMVVARSALLETEGTGATRGIARLAAADGDLVRALDLALATDDLALATAVAPALSALWLHRGLYAPVRPMLAATVDLLDRALAPPADRAHVRGWLALLDAECRTDTSDTARLEKALLEAANMARSSGDIDVRLRTLMFVTLAARTVHNFDSAAAAADEGIALAEAEQRVVWLGRFEAEAGMVAQKIGDNDRAATLGLRALRRGRSTDDERMVVRAVAVLRPPGAQLVEPRVACPTIDEALTLAIAAGDATAMRYLYPMAAVDAFHRGHTSLAAQRCADGLREAIESGSADYGRINALVLSGVSLFAGEPEVAAELLGVVADDWPRLSPGMALVTQRAGDLLFRLVPERLSDGAFELALRRGAARSPQSALDWALDQATRLASDRPLTGGPGNVLTARELAVLQLIARGLPNKEIAVALGITPKTATHHTSAIYRKLGVRGRTEAAAVAHQHGLTAAT